MATLILQLDSSIFVIFGLFTSAVSLVASFLRLRFSFCCALRSGLCLSHSILRMSFFLWFFEMSSPLFARYVCSSSSVMLLKTSLDAGWLLSSPPFPPQLACSSVVSSAICASNY
uniref:Uncharacterized protein n=1 Tax=Ixodes ricinus TaxID=34613 RepID=A0A6B0UL24_IXORI